MPTGHTIDYPTDPSPNSGHQRRPTLRRRPAVNISGPERIGRVAVGVLAMVAGALLLTAGTSVLVVLLEVLLVAAGADLAVTGALGHCPLYAKLGHVPPSLRGRP